MDDRNEKPYFSRLVSVRARMTAILSMLLFALLSINLLLMSTWAESGARPWIEGSSVSLSLAVIIATIVVGALIAILYIGWANRVLDKLVELAITERSQAEKAK